MGYNILHNGETIKIIDFESAASLDTPATDVEGCHKEDWEMYELFKLNNHVKRRMK